MNHLLNATRRHFFKESASGLGKIGLASLLSGGTLLSGTRSPHFPAKIESVIHLYMSGGPSQFELFDYRPKLQQLDGQPLPKSLLEGKRFAFMDDTRKSPTLYAPRRKFHQYGQSGKWVCECLLHLAQRVDDIAFLAAVAVDYPNPCAGHDFCQHRLNAVRPAEHGFRDHLRNW